ncbi:uncharacterized protein LOC124389678 isoform X2 [Silurus meridionalis]|uniref:uncharacterized protein LOC124389678 isoform X2 n=1 Tax=Silurus meridionalis TaxID=175797 RepID=UPI001EE9CF8B|nr:uncharacterized protein LOC124389678 isoform X2 [Silurus meridionalis]
METVLNTEVLWNKALTDNNVKGIICWLRSLTTEGQHDPDKSLAKFNCWLRCSIERIKKELLTLCFHHCHDLWMFLGRTSFTKLSLLTQKLKNLLLLTRWVMSKHTCVMCQINPKAMVQCGCWNRDVHTLRQHILLGRLVQWWSFSGLLPQYPDANELKQISQMWQDMKQHHKTTCLQLRCDIEDKYRGSSIIQDILHLGSSERQNSRKTDSINQRDLGDKVAENKVVVKGCAPIPLSALLYQCLFNGSLTPGDFLRLFREAVTELNSSEKLTRMMVVWPKYFGRTEENRIASQSPDLTSETYCELPISSNPELQKEEPALLQYDRMEVHISPAVLLSGSTSPDHMDSAPHAEGEQEETDDEDCDLLSNNHMSCKDASQCSSIITITGDVPKTVLIKNLCRESFDELAMSENGVEQILACAGNLVDTKESHIMEVTQIESSSKNKQTMLHSTAKTPVNGDNYLIPDYEESLDDMVQEPHSESVRAEDENEQFNVLYSKSDNCQNTICEETFGSNRFLNLNPLKRALPYSPIEKSFRSFCYDSQDAMDQPEILTSCAITETMPDLLEELSEQNLTLKDEEPNQPSVLSSVKNSILVTDLNPVRHGSRPHQLQISLGAPVLPLSQAEKTKDKATSESKNAGLKEVVCFRTTSERMGDCKLGSWWKQALDTRRASTGLLPAFEQVPAVTKEKRHSLVLGWPQCHGLIRGCKQEVKQVR